MNIRFRGVEEVIQNWDKASKALLEAEQKDLNQRQALTTIPGNDVAIGYLKGQADAFIEAAASDPDYLIAPQTYKHFQTAYPHQDALGDTWKQLPASGGLPMSFRRQALDKFEIALNTISAKLGQPAPTAMVDALKALLP